VNSGLSVALENSKAEAVVCGGYNYLAFWQALFWARQRSATFLSWIESNARDRRSGDPVLEFLKRKFLGNCDAVIVAGKSSYEYVRAYSIRAEKIYTAPNAVDIELFARGANEVRQKEGSRRDELGLPTRFFLYVGRLVPEKGVFELLQAYGTLSQDLKQNLGLVFVGDGPARESLMQSAPPEVQFRGFAQREDLPNYYGLADAFVFPTHSDPWGLVVNEAMACGLPIIASDRAGCVEDLVTDGWNGRVVSPQNVEQLAAAMGAMALDEKMRITMGENSRARISTFSPQACAAGIAAAIVSAGESRHA
jgi:glycosyltransferase involved in cell wall biosynthesis